MQPEIRKACRRAGVKLAAGTALVGAVIGLRVVTVEPRGVEADLERPGRELATGSAASARAKETSAGAAGQAEGVEESSRGAPRPAADAAPARPEPEAGDALVSCRLRGSSQFMRAADCAMRGGRATPLAPDR